MTPWDGMTEFSAARISDMHARRWARRAISEARLREPQAVVPANRLGRVVVQGPVTLGDPPRRNDCCLWHLAVVVEPAGEAEGDQPPEVVAVQQIEIA
jgi:hypothetical protein